MISGRQVEDLIRKRDRATRAKTRRERYLPKEVGEGKWTKEEIESYEHFVEQCKQEEDIPLYSANFWIRVSMGVRTRSPDACRQRHLRTSSHAEKETPRRKWEKEEDDLLREMMSSLSPSLTGGGWREIAAHFPTRSAQAVRRRILHLLASPSSPSVDVHPPKKKKCEFTNVEDDQLLQLFYEHRDHWEEYHMKGRTEKEMKTRLQELLPMMDEFLEEYDCL